jgi:hypothetical protein
MNPKSMNPKLFDRGALRFKPLAERKNLVFFPRDAVFPDAEPRALRGESAAILREASGRIRQARSGGRPVICAFGAHAIKNGLGPVLQGLIADGWITHLATNGAGIIHDWEIAFQAATSEEVGANVPRGEFGAWDETCRYLNLGLLVGAWRGLGYGQSIGALIAEEGLEIPNAEELRDEAGRLLHDDPERAAAAADLLSALERHAIHGGPMRVPHPHRRFSVQATAYERGVPFTGHPMIGHDIIYEHPLNSGAAVGRTALRDFLRFAEAVSRLEGGVYLSVGSAVMSPMIFEKSLSMAQNLAARENKRIENHFILVVDLAESSWDWQRDGEPPATSPAYYLRYCKTFSRMGGTMRSLRADNRDFFLSLLRALREG